MGATPKYALPYPELDEPADVPTDMHELATAIEGIPPLTYFAGGNLTLPGLLQLGGSADAFVSRKAPNLVGLTSLRADRDVSANTDGSGGFTANSVAIGHTGSGLGPYIIFGQADTNLYRSSAGGLRTDGHLTVMGQVNSATVGPGANQTQLIVSPNAVGSRVVECGAPDSGGAGKRLLVIPN